MLEKIIKRRFYLAKHLAAPLLREREEYLEYLNSKSLSRNYLLMYADYTLRIVELLNLQNGILPPVTVSEIEAAAVKWSTMELNHPMKRKRSESGKVKFMTVALGWLKRAGRLEPQMEDSDVLINELFFKRHVKKRYIAMPFLAERLSYLLEWKKNGATRLLLREIANYQLHIIHYLQLTELRPVKMEEIRHAAQAWSKEIDIKGRLNNYSKEAGMRFLRFSKGWIAFMGLLIRDKEEVPFMDCMMQYLNDLLEERGYSARTIDVRYSQLKIFLQEVRKKCHALAELTPSMIDGILQKRHEEYGCNRKTISSDATVYRSFLRYASRQGWCREGLAETIKSPRVYHLDTVPSAPTWEDIQGILRSKNTDNPTDIRDYAILLLLAVYGLRRSEVAGLKLKDFDWKNERLCLRRSKRCKPQVFPLLQSVGNAVIRYIKEVRPNESGLEYVFLCRRAPYRAMSAGSIYAVANRILKPLNLNIKHNGPHSLRHGCATHLINSGFSLKAIADQLGHQQLDTTRIYAKVDTVNLRKVAAMDWEGLL